MRNISSFTKGSRVSRYPSLLVLAPGPPSFMRRSSSTTKVSGRKTTRFGRRYKNRLGRTSSLRKNSSSLSKMISPGSSKARLSIGIWPFLGRCAPLNVVVLMGLLYYCREGLYVSYYYTLHSWPNSRVRSSTGPLETERPCVRVKAITMWILIALLDLIEGCHEGY